MSKEAVNPSYSESCLPIATETPNTSIFVLPENLKDVLPVLNKTLRFVKKTSAEIGENYIEGLATYHTLKKEVPYSVLAPIIKSQNMHLPGFDIFDTSTSIPVLEQANYPDERISPDGILLVFKLPRLSSLIWKRFDESNGRKKIGRSAWARLGYDAKTLFNDTTDDESKINPLSFRRINDFGHHDANSFYYLFEVTKQQRQNQKKSKVDNA